MRYRSYNVQETALGFVVTVYDEGRSDAWTARTLEEATGSILNDYNIPKNMECSAGCKH